MRTIVALLGSLSLAQAGELHQAARVCDVDRVRQLLSQDPVLNEMDENGMTPLHVAIDSRQTACVRLLLEAGADRNARDRQGRTALDVALKPPDLSDSKAVQDWRATLLLLWKPSQEKAREPTGPTPGSLEYSVTHSQRNVTEMLLALGADPNKTGTQGTTPLADAPLKGDLDTVRELIAHGARVNTTSAMGTQPIHDAALSDSAEVFRELVKHGADVNALTRDGAQTPLHIAGAMGKMKAVETLVELGADLRIKDSRGRTPFDTAREAGLTTIAAFLRDATAGK